MGKFVNLTGQKFGRLKVINFIGKRKGHYYWNCLCDCGKSTQVDASHLRSGRIKSCGCYNQECRSERVFVHGKGKTRLYRIWSDMKQRCYNAESIGYKYYGARNILIYTDWLNDFMTFYNWSINNGYNENLTIDRINVNGNYEPSNCRWITMKEQAKNRRTKTKNISEECENE